MIIAKRDPSIRHSVNLDQHIAGQIVSVDDFNRLCQFSIGIETTLHHVLPTEMINADADGEALHDVRFFNISDNRSPQTKFDR